MKPTIVRYDRHMLINTGDYSNVNISTPFPEATIEPGETPEQALQALQALNIAMMHDHVVNVTEYLPTFVRTKALRALGEFEDGQTGQWPNVRGRVGDEDAPAGAPVDPNAPVPDELDKAWEKEYEAGFPDTEFDPDADLPPVILEADLRDVPSEFSGETGEEDGLPGETIQPDA